MENTSSTKTTDALHSKHCLYLNHKCSVMSPLVWCVRRCLRAVWWTVTHTWVSPRSSSAAGACTGSGPRRSLQRLAKGPPAPAAQTRGSARCPHRTLTGGDVWMKARGLGHHGHNAWGEKTFCNDAFTSFALF